MAEGAGDAKGEEAPPTEGAPRPPGILDRYLGTKEGRARLILWIWVASVIFMGIGYGLIFWIFIRGGL